MEDLKGDRRECAGYFGITNGPGFRAAVAGAGAVVSAKLGEDPSTTAIAVVSLLAIAGSRGWAASATCAIKAAERFVKGGGSGNPGE